MFPSKSIKSRYATTTINPNFYSTLSISGTTYPLATLTSGGTLSAGYIFAPYIPMCDSSIVIDREYFRKILRAERKEKLEKLGWC